MKIDLELHKNLKCKEKLHNKQFKSHLKLRGCEIPLHEKYFHIYNELNRVQIVVLKREISLVHILNTMPTIFKN